MMTREKIILISSIVDESIKGQINYYDISIYRSFIDFEKATNETFTIFDTLIITSDELPFTNINMTKMLTLLSSPFVEVKGNILYLVDNSHDVNRVNKFLEQRDLDNWVVYQGDLVNKFIYDIVSGEGRRTVESQVELVTYRIRADEYLRMKQNGEDDEDDINDSIDYHTDEDLLSGIKEEEDIIEINPSIERGTTTEYIVGLNSIERTLFTFLMAQYKALNEKTIIIEKDYEYHQLTELVTKSGVSCELIDIQDLFDDMSGVIATIRDTTHRLIVIGSTNRVIYNYNFIFSVLYSNLQDYVSCFIRECNLEETPYGKAYILVIKNFIPDILKCCSSLQYAIEPRNVSFIGLQVGSFGPANVTSPEMKAVIEEVLRLNDIKAQVLRADGILLKGEEGLYDIFGCTRRENRT